jgi:hypothetical protein
MPWRGIVKLPGGGPGNGSPDRAIELELWPDSRALYALLDGDEPQAMLVSHAPIIRYRVFDGRLTELSTNALDTSLMRQTGSGIVGADRTIDLETGTQLQPGERGSGTTMSFPALPQYSVFQVSRDAGVPLVLLAAILILVGLLPALYTSRRKVWVRAEAAGEGSMLKVGGFALQRKPQFEEEFARVLKALTEAAGGPGPRVEGSAGPNEPKEKVPTP